ncbi:MAG: pyruvate kinase [Dehalococcoidales bacterium]|jgi:pyruvate kinase
MLIPNKFFRRRTKIIGTIGPASGSAAVIGRLIRAGMNVARLNLSHGTLDEHTSYIRTVRRLSQRLGVRVAVLIDLPGPKFRTGALKEGRVLLVKGRRVVLTPRPVTGDAELVSVSLPYLAQDVRAGDRILLDDGAIELRVLGVTGSDVTCRITNGGWLTEGRGVVVAGRPGSGPFITDQLRSYLSFAIGQQPDYVALSFVSRAEDVNEVRAILSERAVDIPIIAKIERGQAVAGFDRILEASDAIMVARGDLGVDIPLERVPLVQKEVIRKCNQAGKPVITATEMLESMVSAIRPTRAETTDVANAIYDGSDATMLSAETSVGKYPVQAVRMMARIARETERRLPYKQMLLVRGNWLKPETDDLISYDAAHIAQRLGAAAVVAFTQSGSTAERLAKYRPGVPVLAITPNPMVPGRLMLCWGVYPYQVAVPSSVDELFATAARLCRELGLAKPGDLVVITGGVPIGVAGSTNLLKVERIGQPGGG